MIRNRSSEYRTRTSLVAEKGSSPEIGSRLRKRRKFLKTAGFDERGYVKVKG